ncbi:DUF6777 domain-containing protein [Streptomyces cyanogenus]|uniref:DUF6777 domain-containing protein n=1 Tax=Streptomyces cyanogenus TaxID=80860 RepID=A0ABX7U0F0_STRCY|nr:DUF6777 domain-containing protein [Streptomyces cyanogenus]QTE02500.1 hypothetical protein S1361_34535 [Streptomyces cyanogenus]
MRIPTRTIVTACAFLVTLLATGCAGTGVKQTRAGELVLLQAATERGPEPFTESTDTGVPRSQSPRVTARVQPGDVEAPLRAARTLSGATPGLYRGSPRVAGCDVERHIRHLAADEDRADAFAGVAGVTRAELPGYLRGLTPVLLAADTRVTSHAYRDHAAARYQAVLQAGTAVLVDNRGVPRVRCACGNPLDQPTPTRGGAGARGTPWAGYRPNQVVVVAPASRPVTSLTIVDAASRTWIERRVGPDVRRDRVVPAPPGATGPADPERADAGTAVTGQPRPDGSGPPASPGGTGMPPSPSVPAAPDRRTGPPDRNTATRPPSLAPDPVLSLATSGETGPPRIQDKPDGAGTTPADPPLMASGTATRAPTGPAGTAPGSPVG